MKYLFLILILCVTSLIMSCTEEDNNLSKIDLLTQNWVIEAVDVNGNPSSANYNFSFQDNKTYSFSSSDPDLSIPGSGQWEFNSNETKILINGGSIELLIITLTSDELIFEYTYDNYKMGKVTYRFIFNVV